MRWIRGTLFLSAAVAVITLLALSWRAQLHTQQKLDALAAALAGRPAEPPAPQTVLPAPESGRVPRELEKITLPPYLIEAPDQLLIEAAVKDPTTGTVDRLPVQPISGTFPVRLDGTVGLGFWGSVSVTGLTLEQASAAIRGHLAKSAEKFVAENLVVVVDVAAYNSKRYYVITDGGSGEQVHAFPLTGNETVLDALANVGGLAKDAGKLSMRLVRNQPGGTAKQVLPVEWLAITQHGVTTTNYQLFPGDRVYVTRARTPERPTRLVSGSL